MQITQGTWINTLNGNDYQVTHVDGGDVFVARLDGTDGRMVMREKFERYFARPCGDMPFPTMHGFAW